MALPADYISGTITLTNGSPDFTGTGTGWQAADFREGDILLGVEDHAGQVYVIEAITGNAAGTLTQAWAGTSGTYTYRMRYEWDSSRVSAQARAMVELLGNGNLEAFAGLTGAVDQVPVFTGPGAMTLAPLAPAQGSITNAQLADVPTATLKGRTAAGAGAPTDLTAAQVWSLMGVAPVANIPATLTPDKAYRRGNIVGTVSQSGGVPTGAVIERGSNANGEYIRFADGTQIATRQGFTVTQTDANNIFSMWSFPANFVGSFGVGFIVPAAFAAAFTGVGVTDIGAMIVAPGLTSGGNFGWRRTAGAASFPSGASISDCSLFYFGRWF